MLKQLSIHNIILVEKVDISFERGLNVITGETGAGKSAIMAALSLILGDRADAGIIRKDCDKGVVEAVFDVDALPALLSCLEQAGINHESGDDLIIRREVNSSGKSRAFINNQMAQLAILRTVGKMLVDMVGQHANQRLQSLDNHRQIVDIYGGLGRLLSLFGSTWQKENSLRKQLHALVSSEAQRLREIQVCRMELEELDLANLKEGEEEELFAEYSLLDNAQERAAKAQELLHILEGEKSGVLTLLKRHKNSLDHLVRIDPSLGENAASYCAALVELQEVAYSLQQYQSRIEHDPERSSKVDERLTLINRLKRKYGATVQDICAYKNASEIKLQALENADEQIEGLREELHQVEQLCQKMCTEITQSRTAMAHELSQVVVGQLRALNMPKVEFQVAVTPQKRSENGDDRVEFYLTPNVGENSISIKDCASGGELSRLMLAIQAALAGKEQTPTLVFDEIDSNIGGQTALVVGEKLSEIGGAHQVLCITHFSQVAGCAAHHLQIYKQEIGGRTITQVRSLDLNTRQSELARMQGALQTT